MDFRLNLLTIVFIYFSGYTYARELHYHGDAEAIWHIDTLEGASVIENLGLVAIDLRSAHRRLGEWFMIM